MAKFAICLRRETEIFTSKSDLSALRFEEVLINSECSYLRLEGRTWDAQPFRCAAKTCDSAFTFGQRCLNEFLLSASV